MGDDSCSCCGSIDDRPDADEERRAVADTETDRHGPPGVDDAGADARPGDGASDDAITDRLLSGEAPLAASLPADLGRALGDVVGESPVETLDEWVALLREQTGGGAIETADLCHVAEPTPHWGDLDGDRHHFACFYDAVVLAALADRPVDVRTESPEGAVVEARAVGSDSLRVDPATAVFSVGADPDAAVDGEPSHADLYDAVCPYVKAFPSVAAYDRWRRTVPAPTVATSLDGATDLAAALVADG